MTSQQLSRVNQIDSEITDLNQLLRHLYFERDGLIDRHFGLDALKPTAQPNASLLARQLRRAWAPTGLTLPPAKTLQPLLRAAVKRYTALTKLDSGFNGNLNFVLVPRRQNCAKRQSRLTLGLTIRKLLGRRLLSAGGLS